MEFVLVCVTITESRRLGHLNNLKKSRNLFPIVTKAESSKIKVLASNDAFLAVL